MELKGKGQKKKKLNLKFTIDCTHPVEDGIMNPADFVRDLDIVECKLKAESSG